MPIAKFRMPDGRVAKFQVPDGTTPEDAQHSFEQWVASPEGTNAMKGVSNPGLPGGGSAQPPAPQSAPQQAPQAVAQHTPWGPKGSVLQNIQDVLATPPGGFQSPTLNNLARGTGLAAGALAKGVTSTSGLIADAAAALAGKRDNLPSQQFGNLFPQPQGFGEKALDLVGSVAAGSMGDPVARLATQGMEAAAPQPRQPTVRELSTMQGRDAGLVNTPSQGNGSLVGRTLESVSGKTALQQTAQTRNQSTVNTLAKRALGLPDSAQLDSNTMDRLIKDTYSAGYEPIRQAGPITTGGVYRKALDKVLTESGGGNASFPQAVDPEVQNLVNSFRVKGYDANDAIDAIQALRKNASQAYAQGNVRLARAHNGIAGALEDNIALNLDRLAGSGIGSDTVAAFKGARQKLAQQYQVQRALNPATGDVNALKLASTFQRRPGYLTGDLATIGKYAAANPSVMRPPSGAAPIETPTIIRSALGGLLGGPTGAAAATAAPFGKMGLRAALLSQPAQRAFVDPNLAPSLMERGIDPALLRGLPAFATGLYGGE